MKNKVLVILGPTATGKTKLAVKLARQFNGEIISADSRQVYKGMDIGTGKDLAEYGTGKTAIKYHLIDVINPRRSYDLYQYQKAAYKAILGVLKRHKLPILVGGSGLYLQAVVDGYMLDDHRSRTADCTDLERLTLIEIQKLIKKTDKKFFERLNNSEKNNKRRLIRYLEILNSSKNFSGFKKKKPPFEFLIIGLEVGKETLRKNIKDRIIIRLDHPVKPGDDIVEEVRRLHKQGLSWKRLESFGLEYKFIALYLQKKLSRDEMIEKLSIATNQFAKRQIAWLRRWEKQGREISWFKPKDEKKMFLLTKKFLK